MPAPRSFDYDYLKRLVREHPDWSHQEYATALTGEVRQRTRNPKSRRILPNAVAAVLHRYRPIWEEEGFPVPPRKGAGRKLPWVGIPEGYRMGTALRRMRTLARIDAGEAVDPRDARLAEQMARRFRERSQVLDLTPAGRPVVRGARPDEIDGTGELLSLYSRHPGLTEDQWAGMNPAERRKASARWFPGGIHPEDHGDTPARIA